MRTDVARLLGVPLNKVRILSTELGGGFGGKASGITSGAAIEPICALLAVKAKRPVMIVLDKAEETISTPWNRTWIRSRPSSAWTRWSFA